MYVTNRLADCHNSHGRTVKQSVNSDNVVISNKILLSNKI